MDVCTYILAEEDPFLEMVTVYKTGQPKSRDPRIDRGAGVRTVGTEARYLLKIRVLRYREMTLFSTEYTAIYY